MNNSKTNLCMDCDYNNLETLFNIKNEKIDIIEFIKINSLSNNYCNYCNRIHHNSSICPYIIQNNIYNVNNIDTKLIKIKSSIKKKTSPILTSKNLLFNLNNNTHNDLVNFNLDFINCNIKNKNNNNKNIKYKKKVRFNLI